MSEPIKAYHFAVHARAAAEQYVKAKRWLVEIVEACGPGQREATQEDKQVIRHLFGLAEVELKKAEESLGRLRQKVQQLAVERVLDQCS